jgi:hypothetical protein
VYINEGEKTDIFGIDLQIDPKQFAIQSINLPSSEFKKNDCFIIYDLDDVMQLVKFDVCNIPILLRLKFFNGGESSMEEIDLNKFNDEEDLIYVVRYKLLNKINEMLDTKNINHEELTSFINGYSLLSGVE